MVNPWVAGNGGGIWANGGPMHELPASATIVIPANSVLVFARDSGD
jgi:1,4-alpha-glucan branching enzyme